MARAPGPASDPGVILPAGACPGAVLSGPGAYILVIELAAPLALAIPCFKGAVLAPGRYAYCGSARGPGGLKARVARHMGQRKRPHWHVDALLGEGRVVAVHAEAGGGECALVARLLARRGTSVPVPGFGATDCRRCAAHLVRLPNRFDPRNLGP